MNIVKYTRDRLGVSQAELARMISGEIPGIDRATVSRLETGLVDPSEALLEWLLKACAQPNEGTNAQDWATLREAEKKSLKSDFWVAIYEMLEKASADNPATRAMLCIRTGKSDRQVRDAISEMRGEGILIVPKRGYWLCQTDEDFQLLCRQYLSRIRSCNKTLKAIKMSSPDQLVMEVAGE